MTRTTEKPVNKMLANARRRAKRRGQPMELTHQWLQKKLDHGRCEVTALKFYTGEPYGHDWWTHPRAPSLHRVDPSKGYTKANTVVVVWQYNCSLNHWPEHYLHELSLAVLKLFPIGG
jgi:hypothetical protein